MLFHSHKILGRQFRAGLVAEGIGVPGFCFVILPSSACGFHLIFPHGCFSSHRQVCVPACGRVEKGSRQGQFPSLSRLGPEIAYVTSPTFCYPEFDRLATPTCKGDREMQSLAGMFYTQLKLILQLKKGKMEIGEEEAVFATLDNVKIMI